MEAFNYYILNELKKKDILKIIEKNSMVTITDRLGRIEYASDCYCNLLECEPNQIIGESNKLIRSHLHSGLLYKNLWKTIRSGEKWSGILSDESFKGNTFWLQTMIIPLKSNKAIKYLAIYNNVTKFQQEKQKQLKANKANKTMLENMPFHVFEISRFGKIINVNKNFETYKVYELIDNYLYDVIHPKWLMNFKDSVEAVFKLKVPHKFKEVKIDSEGNKKNYNIMVSPIIEDTRQFTSAVVTIQEIAELVKNK